MHKAHARAVPKRYCSFLVAPDEVVPVVGYVDTRYAIVAQTRLEEWAMLLLRADIENLDVARRIADKSKGAALMSEQLDTVGLPVVAILFFHVKLILHLLEFLKFEDLAALVIIFTIEALK